jgi:hypothetical protein
MKQSWGKARIGAITIVGAATLVIAAIILNNPRLVQAQLAQLSSPAPNHIALGGSNSAQTGSQQLVRPRTALHPVLPSNSPIPISGTWVPLNHQPSFSPESTFVLTDGRILAQDANLTNIGWWTFKPDNTGSYINGQWTKVASPSTCPNGYPGQSASTTYSPLYYGSAVLPDGRFVMIGGEYNYNYNYPTGGSGNKVSNEVWTDQGAIYDPVANSWTCITSPTGWIQIGDAQTAVLKDGTFLIANPFSNAVDTLDVTTSPPTFNPPFTPSGKPGDNSNDEEGWELLPDGSVLVLEVNDPSAEATDTPAFAYDPASQEWDSAGIAPDPLVFTSIGEIGPALLRPDGTVFAEGATGFNDVYDTLTGTWSGGPSFPTITESYSAGMCNLVDVTEQFAAVDAPSVLLPDGNVLAAVSPYDTTPHCAWITPTEFFEFDGTNLTKVNAPPNAPNDVSYNGRLLDLPNGQIMWTDGTGDVEIYEPSGTYNSAWAPTITSAPIQVAVSGTNYTLAGTQFNGLSQAVSYGDDYQGATNYPLVRITNNASGHVTYARTHNHSTMGIVTGSEIVSTEFDVPAGIETGPSTLVVVANGIPSQPVHLLVGNVIVNDLVVVPGSERVQLAHGSDPMTDQLNMAFTFTDNGNPAPPTCNDGNNALNSLEVTLEEGTCAALPGTGESVGLAFVQHVVRHLTYGTDYYVAPGAGGAEVSARMVALPAPGGTCGEWTLNLELSDLDLAFHDLSGVNPFALVLEDGNGNLGCFDVNNAVVGNQIDPPGRTVRRGVRR